MKYFKFYCLALCLAVSTCLAAESCAQDYECGTVPFNRCLEGINQCTTTTRGLVIDDNDNLYFPQYCNTEIGYGNHSIKRVSVNGGETTKVHTQLYSLRYGNIYEVHAQVNGYLYFSTFAPLPGRDLKLLDLSTSEVTFTVNYTTFFNDMDIDGDVTYACNFENYNYTIDKYNGYLLIDNPERNTLFKFNKTCSVLRAPANSDYLYVATTEYQLTGIVSEIYRGSKNEPSTPELLFTLTNSSVNGLAVLNDKIYYTTLEGGVFYSDLDGENRVNIWDQSSQGIRVKNNKIYWNSIDSIYSADLDGNNRLRLDLLGQCGCADGFTGSDCSQCEGQVQWSGATGLPSCVPMGEDGFPTRCLENWHCGNQPFTSCAGRCMCKLGLANPPACNACANSTQSIQWENGQPECR